MFAAGYNQPGFLPEEEPTQHETFDEAKRALIEEMLRHADQAGEAGYSDLAETIDGYAQDVNLWSEPVNVETTEVAGWVYWIAAPTYSHPSPSGWVHPQS